MVVPGKFVAEKPGGFEVEFERSILHEKCDFVAAGRTAGVPDDLWVVGAGPTGWEPPIEQVRIWDF